jgi:photosynthetic reaction center H subunit
MAYDDRTNITGGAQSGALVHSKDLDSFKIPEGQPDPRGWSVKSADGTTLGKVEDLLFDTGEERVRYIEVRTDGDISKHGGRDYFLLPIGTARLDDENDDVVVNMAAEELTGVPPYERGKMSREYEASLRDYVRERPGSGRPLGTDREVSFYGSPEYDDASFFSRGRHRGIGSMGATGGAADRATSSGLGDRIADKADDLKDRFDGNPASRPGPDPTDRRI